MSQWVPQPRSEISLELDREQAQDRWTFPVGLGHSQKRLDGGSGEQNDLQAPNGLGALSPAGTPHVWGSDGEALATRKPSLCFQSAAD